MPDTDDGRISAADEAVATLQRDAQAVATAMATSEPDRGGKTPRQLASLAILELLREQISQDVEHIAQLETTPELGAAGVLLAVLLAEQAARIDQLCSVVQDVIADLVVES